MAIIYCGNMECKYCNDKYKCTNKKVELNFIGINTTYQGFQKLLKCTSFEESDQYKKAKILIDKFCDFEFNSEFEVVDYMYQKRKKIKDIEHDRDYYERNYTKTSEENIYLLKRIEEKEKIIENLFNILGNK